MYTLKIKKIPSEFKVSASNSNCSCGSGTGGGGFHTPIENSLICPKPPIKKPNVFYAQSTAGNCSCGSGTGSGGFHAPQAKRITHFIRDVYAIESRNKQRAA